MHEHPACYPDLLFTLSQNGDSMSIFLPLQVVDIYAAMRRDERLKWYM